MDLENIMKPKVEYDGEETKAFIALARLREAIESVLVGDTEAALPLLEAVEEFLVGESFPD